MEGQLHPAASATQAIYLWLSYQSSPWVRLLSHWACLRAGDGQPQHHRGSFQDPIGESPEQPGLGSRLTLLWAWAWARALLRSLQAWIILWSKGIRQTSESLLSSAGDNGGGSWQGLSAFPWWHCGITLLSWLCSCLSEVRDVTEFGGS